MSPRVAPVVLAIVLLAWGVAGCAPRVASHPEPSVRESLSPPSPSAMSWFLRARAAESAGDLEEAERALQWVVRKDGRRAVTHEHLAAFYARTRRWDEAREAWNRALTRDPTRWQPHAGLATLEKRAGHAELERSHLQSAVERFADAATHERLVLLQIQANELTDARSTYRRWRTLDLDDPVLLMRRARAGRRLGLHELALDDLIQVSEVPGRTGDTAELIAESARASCRLQTGWSWARRASPVDPIVRRAALDLADAVGDASLVERLIAEGELGPLPTPVHKNRAHGVPTSVDHPAVLAAELWRRADRPRRALALAGPIDDPWARVIEALAAMSLRDPTLARAALKRVPADHPAQAWGLTLALGLEDIGPVKLQRWVDAHPEGIADVALAAAELHGLPGMNADFIQVRGLRLHGGAAPAPDTVVRLPGEPAAALERVLTQRAITAVLSSGRGAEARELAETWTARRPDEADAWVARAQSDAEHANTWLSRALELEPCHADALLLSSHHAPEAEQVAWLRRAQEAAPLSHRVQQALSRRGLGAR